MGIPITEKMFILKCGLHFQEVLMEVSDVLREHGYTEGLERELDLTMYEFVM